MYFLSKVKLTIPVTPDELRADRDMDELLLEKLRKDLELDTDEKLGYIIAVLDVKSSDLGKIIPGSPEIYFDAEVTLLVFKPVRSEVVEGPIVDITQGEVFVNLGCIDARCTVQNLVDGVVRYVRQPSEDGTPRPILRVPGKKIIFKVGDILRARVQRFEYVIPVEIGPMVRGHILAAPRVIKPKSEIKISLIAKERGLGLVSELEKERAEVLGG